MEDSKMMFELTAQQIKYKDILNKEFLEMEIWAISNIDPNRHNTHFTDKSMEDALPGCKNKPIVGFFKNNDFVDHTGKIELDTELQQAFWNTEHGERVLGVIRESDPVEIVEDENGLKWIKVRCVLFVSYCYKQIKRLLRDKTKKVSVEITIHEQEKREDGVIDILSFTLNGITILGSKNGKQVMEAIPGAHATILEQLDEDVLEKQKKMLSFAYDLIDDNDDDEGNNDDKHDDINVNNDERKEDARKMEHRELEDKLWRILSQVRIPTDDGYNVPKYITEKIYDTHIIVMDQSTGDRFKLLYKIEEDEVLIDWESMKSLADLDEAIREAEEHYAVKEEEIGTGENIDVDKSKDSMSERDWGAIDKGLLREKVIKAGNFKEIAGDIFLDLVEGWENGEVSKLKYPVMEIDDNKAVYNRGALASAKAFAERNDEDTVLTKLKAIYNTLELEFSVKEKESSGECAQQQADQGDPVTTPENMCDNGACGENNDCGCDNDPAPAAAENPDQENQQQFDCDNDNNNADETPVQDGDENKDDASAEPAAQENPVSAEPDPVPVDQSAVIDQLNAELKATADKCAELQAMCDKYASNETECANKIAELEANLAKFSDYEEIKARMEKAEKTVWEHFCNKMKCIAEEKMGCEEIANEDREQILMKASKGEYADEEMMDKDIAYAVYKAHRKTQHTNWEHFSVDIHSGAQASVNDSRPLTRQERIAMRATHNKNKE